MTSRDIRGLPVSPEIPSPLPSSPQPIPARETVPGSGPRTGRDSARDAQDLSRTEGSRGFSTEGTSSGPRERLTSQLVEFNRLRQSESPQDREQARRMLAPMLVNVREVQSHLSTAPRDLSRDLLMIRQTGILAAEFLNTHRSRAGTAAFRREGAQLVDFQQARDQAEASLRTLRQQVVLPSLPAPGAAPTLEHLRSARLAAAISRELGDLETARADCQTFRNLLSRIPRSALQGQAGHEFLDETLRFAVRSQSQDPMMGEIALIAAHRVAWLMPAADRDLALYQFLAVSQSLTGPRIERMTRYCTRYLENRLREAGISTETRSQRALEQGQAILWLRSHGTEIETPPAVLSALRNGGGILARYAEALNPESRERPDEVLASLANRTPRTLSEHLAVRFGAELRAQATATDANGQPLAGDPLQRAFAGFDAAVYNRVARLDYYASELRELSTGEGALAGPELARARAAFNSIREVRAQIDGHLSEDPQLQAFQLQSLLSADRQTLAMRQRLGSLYGSAPRELLGETDQVYAETNSRLQRSIQSGTQALTELRARTVTAAQDANTALATRIQGYRLANQIDIALGLGNDRARDLSEWQTLMAQATDSDVSTADRFTDLGTILSGFHALRQRQYDERSLDLRDTDWRWGDLVSPFARGNRELQAQIIAADPSRVQMSQADLSAHMTQARDSLFALLAIVNPPTDPLAQATNSHYQAEVNVLLAAQPGGAAETAAARVLPMLSADGFVNFQSEPSVEIALVQTLTDQANQHLSQGHVTVETLRDPASAVSMENGQSRPLSDFIAGAENNRLTFSDAYRGLSIDDQRRVIQQALHLGRLGEYRAALAAETDPVRRHFRSALLELEQGNVVRGQAELQTFLRDVRQPGEDHTLRPIADPQLAAMRTVALDMNRRLMGQALDRMAQVSTDLDAQRSENVAGFLDRDFGGNEATLQALRTLIDDPTLGFYSLDEALPVVRQQRIAAAQAAFARGISADAPILLPCGPNVVGLHNIGNLSLPEMSAMQQRQQALEAAAYRGMAVSGPGLETRFGAEGLIPSRNTRAIFTAFHEHPDQALVGVPTLRLPARGQITFAPHRGADRERTSILRVEVPPEGGVVMVESFRTGQLQRTVFPPSDGPRFVLLYQHHGMHGSSHRSGLVRAEDGIPIGTHTEFDPILTHFFDFESYASIQSRAESPDANRRASLALADRLRTREGSYTAAARIYEEVMADVIHQAERDIPRSELQRVTLEAEAARPEIREEIHRRVFQMVERGMPRPSQSTIDNMIDQAVQQRARTQVRMLTFQRIRDRRDQLDPIARQAWDSFNDMMDPLDEWLNFSDSTQDRIIDEVVVNLAFTVASGGVASVAAGATRAVATRLAARWLAAEGTTWLGERAALWAAGQGVTRYGGRALLWTMGETATQSGRQIAARALIWGAGVGVEGVVFHASMTGMQSTWGYIRNGEWVFPPPGEFATGAAHSVLMMGSIGVGNAVWGRIGSSLGVTPQQIARMTELSRAERAARLAVHHTGQLATEVAAMTATTPRPEGQSFTTAAAHNLATILELRAGGHLFHGLTGHRLQRYQQQIENEILQTRVRSIVQERFGLDPNSAEGRLMAGAIHHSLAGGTSIDAVAGMATRERLEVLRRSVRQELNVDPSSEQGQILTSLLLRHTMGRARGPRGMDAAMMDVPGRLGELNQAIRGIAERSGLRGEPAEPLLQSLLAQALSQGHDAESLQSLNASLTLLIEGGGFGTGEEAAQLRISLLNFALATGRTHEQIAEMARHADGLRDRIHDLTNQLYGAGASRTPFGRSVSSQLLIWALSQPGNAAEIPGRLEALTDAMPRIIETLEAGNRELGLSNSSLEGLRNFHHLFTWAMAGSPSAAEIQQRLETSRREMPRLRAELRQITQTLGYAEGTEGANRIAGALLTVLAGEPGGEAAFNRTRMAAYLSSIQDFGRQIDLILSAESGASLRPYRSQIVELAIRNSMTPEALNRLGQELHTGRRRLEISADGQLHTVEDPTVAPVGEITLPPTEPVVATVPANAGGTRPLREAARHGRGPRSEAALEAALALPQREVFIGDQVRDAREIAESASLGGNQDFLRGLAQMAATITQRGDRGFATGAQRRQFLTEQLRRARALAEAAGQGENRALLQRLGTWVTETLQGAERGFAPAEAVAPLEPQARGGQEPVTVRNPAPPVQEAPVGTSTRREGGTGLHPEYGRILPGTEVGGFRMEGSTLHVDFRPENLMTRRISVNGQVFSIHHGMESFTLRNESPSADHPITVIHANPEHLNLQQTTYDFRIQLRSESLGPEQMRGAVQVSSVEPLTNAEGQATGEVRIRFQLPDGQAHHRILTRLEAEQSFGLPLTAEGRLDPSRPAPNLVQTEGRSIGHDYRPREESLGSLEDTFIAPGDRITIGGETIIFAPELPPAAQGPGLQPAVQAVVQTEAQSRPTYRPPRRAQANVEEAQGNEGRAQPLTPPPSDQALQAPAFPRPPRVPSPGMTLQSHVDIRLVELAFPPGYARPSFTEFTLTAEARNIAEHLESSGHGELARALREDLQSLESTAHDSPEFEAAIQRVGSMLHTRYIEGEFSRTPVPFMSDNMFLHFADRIREIYGHRSMGPNESGVRRTDQPRRGVEVQPVVATGTEGNGGERGSIRPGQVTVLPGGGTSNRSAAPIPPLPETGPIGEAVQRGRRLAAGDSPLAPHARRVMDRLAQMNPDSPEFRSTLAEAETLTEIARDAQLTVPEAGHPEHDAIAARRALAQSAQSALERSRLLAEGDSPIASHARRAMERLPRARLGTPEFRLALTEAETLIEIANSAQHDANPVRQALARQAQTILARGEAGSATYSLALKTYRLAAGDSPLARHAAPVLERLAQSEQGTPEFRAALVEADTLTEIANTAQLRLPPRGHPQHRFALGFQALARGAEGSLGRVAPGSPEYQQGLAAYRRGRDSVARDLVESHRSAMENVLGFLREVGQGGEAWTRAQQAYPFLEPPRMAESIPPHGRLKAEADVLAKLNRRDWTSLEPMTDLAGTRVVVEGYEDVTPLLAAIQARTQAETQPRYTIREVRDAEGNVTSARDRDGMRRLIEGARSGYRAIHIVVEVEGRPVEIQVQTRAMYEWGRIQHGLIYAEVRGSSGGGQAATYALSGPARRAADAYCTQVASYLADIEQGATLGERPSADAVIRSLPADIPADARRSVMAELTRMDELITATERRFRQPAEESPGGAQIIAFPRRGQAPVERTHAEAAGETESSPPPPTFVSPFPAGAEGVRARQTFARALETQLNGAFGDMMEASEITAARAYVQAVGRGEEPSAEATAAALEAFSYRTTRTLADGSHISGGMIRIPAEEPAPNSMFRATVLSVNSAEGTVRLRWREHEFTLRGLEHGPLPFRPDQVVTYIPAIAGASGATFRMTPPGSGASVGEISPMSGVQEFTVGREHGQGYDDRMSRNHAVFRRGPDGRWTVEDLNSLNGVHIVGPGGQPLRLPPGRPALLQDGSAVQIGQHWYTFRPPLEPAMVVPAPELRPGFPEPAILAPRPGQTRFSLQPGVTVERAGDHWYLVSGETRLQVNGQTRHGTNPLRDGDLVEIGGRTFRFQSELRVLTHGQDVARIAVPEIGHARVGGFDAAVVSGRIGSDGHVELWLAEIRLPITQPIVQVASLLRLPREIAEQHGFRFNSDGMLAAGSPTHLVVRRAEPAPPPHPAIEVIDHSASGNSPVGGGPYRGANPVERVELPHPVDQQGNSYTIENHADPRMAARLEGRGVAAAHPIRAVLHPDGTAYVTFDLQGQSGAPARRVVLRMSTDQARDLLLTQRDRPARDYLIRLRQAAPRPAEVPQPQGPQAPPPPQPLEVTASNGQSFQILPVERSRGLEAVGQAQPLNLGQFFGLNPRILPDGRSQLQIVMEVVETRRLSENPRPQGETILISLTRTQASELGILRPNGTLVEVIGLNRAVLPPGAVNFQGRGERGFTFGREATSGSADLTVSPEMRMVSRHQAVFRFRDGTLSLRSLAPEGTWVLGANGQWTELQPSETFTALPEGSRIAFGRPQDVREQSGTRTAPFQPRGGEHGDLLVFEVRGGQLQSLTECGLRWAEPVIPRTPPAPIQRPLGEAAREPASGQGDLAPRLAAVAVPPAQGPGLDSSHSYRIHGPQTREGHQVYRLSLDERGAPGHVPVEIEISSPVALEDSAIEGLLSPRRREAGVDVRATYRDRIPLADMPNGGSRAPLVDFYAVTDAEAMGSASSPGQPSVAIVDPTARTSSSDPLFAIQRHGSGHRLILQGEGVQVRDSQGQPHPPIDGNARAFDLRPGDRVRFGMTELSFDGQGFRMVARLGSDEVSTEARLRVPAGG